MGNGFRDTFRELELSAPQLDQGSWSVEKATIILEDGISKCKLGSVSEDKELFKVIKIHSHKLVAPLDLSTITFHLTFLVHCQI